MALIGVKNLSMSFGGPRLLDGVSFQIEEGQRLCILGRNGEGKSTLLRLLSGDLVPDAGEIVRSAGLVTARLSQKVPEVLTGTVREVVTQGLGDLGRAMAEYRQAGREADRQAGDEAALARMADLEARIQSLGGWEALSTVEAVMSRLGLDPDAAFENLSGGVKRRALLARALAADPDLLLLDEPTNHLDIDTIAWLEDFLVRRARTLVFITHDRQFLRRVATRIIELDRGRLADWTCDYDTFLARKEALLAAEEKNWADFDKKLAQEEVWVRQGIKARRTRNEGRVRALMDMRAERRQRRERGGAASMVLQEAERSGRLVVEARGLGFSWGDAPVFSGLDLTILRGDRLGLIGPNGAGKTTLIQVLLGHVPPTTGTVRLGTRLEVAYFDQHRETLDPAKTVRESVAEGNDTVLVDGRARHVMGYLKDFLFPADRANSQVAVLSGGERNRLLLARLFARPSNVLVMDEPTNDLDAETLELLEERLLEYSGTVILVSHDRAFLNNVVTGTLAFEGHGAVREYVGGYDDWLRQRPEPAAPSRIRTAPGLAGTAPGRAAQEPDQAGPGPASPEARPRKLGFKEQREKEALAAELAALPARIEALEQDLETVHAALADPDLYKGSAGAIATANARQKEAEEALALAFARWEEVEARLKELGGEG